MSRPEPSLVREWSPAVSLATVTAGILAWVLGRNWPHVGFDFSYFLPRLLDVRLHQMAEGWWSVQWWTPSFGGGLPAFPNPQHTQFMPAQGLVPLLGPWGAAVFQACLCLFAGMLFVFHACRRLGCTAEGSLVATAAWGTTGFFWEHALTGHMGFNSFPLLAILPLALQRSLSPTRGIALLGLTGAFFVFTGGYTIVLTYALSALLLAWVLPLWRPADFKASVCLGRLALGGVMTALLASAKIVAVDRFLAVFPRLADYEFAGNSWAGAAALAGQLFGHNPMSIASRWLPFSRDDIRQTLGGGEHVGFSVVITVLLAVGLRLAIRQHRAAVPSARLLWLGLLLSGWLVAEVALGRGLVWPTLKPLPFLRTLHENHRLTSAYLLPLALLAAPAWDLCLARIGPRRAVTATSAILLLCLLSLEPYRRSHGLHHFSGFNAATVTAAWTVLESHPGERPAIDHIADLRDDEGFLYRASSWKPYEPMFGYGYGGPEFRPQTVPGPIRPPGPNAAFNFTDARTLISPAGLAAGPFTLLAADESAALDRLLQHRQPTWSQPAAQRLSGWLTLLSLVVAAASLAWPNRQPPALLPLRSTSPARPPPRPPSLVQ